jgi:3-oxoacyl-[acyl-carrier protein] reductase
MLKDKIAVVTGANRGIGLAISQKFAINGAFVILCVRNTDSIDLNEIAPHGLKASFKVISLDLEDEQSIKNAIREIALVTKNKIDVLVNNAGTASGGLLHMTSIVELRRVFEVNFFGQVMLTQGLSRLMSRHREGSIINIASTAVDIADPGTFGYGASKAALVRASKSMATELGHFGVRVNVISPGVTKTDMFDEMALEARMKLINSSILKRAAEPHDIADAALFLASDMSSFITGQVLRVDGGII